MTEIKTQMIEFASNEHTTPGYLAQPAEKGEYPGIVVIQEWWGLVPHIKDVTERFARQGYIALAPDLYHGQAAGEPDEARKLVMALDIGRAVKEIRAAMRYLSQYAGIPLKKVGVVGWCMGGSLSIATAAQSGKDLGAAVVFYGNARDFDIVKDIQAPLLGLYAEHDHGISSDFVHNFEEALNQRGIPNEFHVYPGTEHAFFNDTRPHIYQEEAAKDAWERTLAWFRKYLG
jgi:carboxymethylenebutenolidase